MSLENAKWTTADMRQTRRARNLRVIVGRTYATPEAARAAWDARTLLSAETMRKMARFHDLVLIIGQYEPRAKGGVVDILSIDLRLESVIRGDDLLAELEAL